MGVQSVTNVGKYLDLLTIQGRSQINDLRFLKDRIASKANVWKSFFLNYTGNEVLIKAVMTTTLTYIMSLFKLPKTWCTEISKLITLFWWSGKENEKKKYIGSNEATSHYQIVEELCDSRTRRCSTRPCSAKQLSDCKMILTHIWHESLGASTTLTRRSYKKKGARALWVWSSLLSGQDFI